MTLQESFKRKQVEKSEEKKLAKEANTPKGTF